MANALVAETPAWGSSWTKLYETLAMDVVYPDPGAMVIFPDNHDMNRIFTQLNEDYDLFRMAMVYVLTMRGTPQIYYGTEILMHNRGSTDHGVIRSDFPGGWAEDDRNAFTGQGLSEKELAAQTMMRKLLNWRREKDVIHIGRLMQFAPFGEVYAYFRYTDEDTVMVIMNKGSKQVSVDATRFAERLGGLKSAVDILTGATFEPGESIVVPARGVLLLDFE